MNIDDYFFDGTKGESLQAKITILEKNAQKAQELRGIIRGFQDINPELSSSNFDSAIKLSSDSAKEARLTRCDVKLDNLYLDICNLDIDSEEDLIAKVKTLLSDYNNVSYLVSKLKLRLFRDITQYSEILAKTKDKAEARDVRAIVDDIWARINIIDAALQEEKVEVQESTKNNLFFLTSENGRVIFYDSLDKDIPKDRYENVMLLLKQMENGIFKGFKSLAPKPFLEVRIDDIRILFNRLWDNNYIIIDVLVKKLTWSSNYQDSLLNLAVQYLNAREFFVQNVDNPEFKSSQQEIYDDIKALIAKRSSNLGGRHG